MRNLTASDICRVREIDRLAFSASEQYESNYYETVMTSEDLEAIGVHDDCGTLVGWALTDLTRVPIRIRSLSVHPEFQRRGFGAALLREILKRHKRSIDLLVDERNVAALALYQRAGFTSAARDPEMPERLRMLRVGATGG